MDQVLYEEQLSLLKFFRIILSTNMLMLFVFVIGGLFWLYQGIRHWKENDDAELHILFGGVFLGVGCWLIVSAFSVVSGEASAYMNAMRRENVKVVEGFVENFSAGNPSETISSERFVIQKVFFEYDKKGMHFGYHKYRAAGGVIKGDGQYLRIEYVSVYKGNGEPVNVILKISEFSSKSRFGKILNERYLIATGADFKCLRLCARLMAMAASMQGSLMSITRLMNLVL